MTPNHALQPTAALLSVPGATADRERIVRSTVALGRLWLSLGLAGLHHFEIITTH